jgi:uncharacterized membrane protein YjdF
VDERSISTVSDRAFWWTMVLFVLIWIVLSVINTFKFDITQMTICIYCTVLLIFNLWSYYKCSKIQKENVNKLISEYGATAAQKYMGGSIISGFV